MPIEANHFRQVMARFATGITVVTLPDTPYCHGITVNAFASVSLAPPLVLTCIDRAAHAHDLLARVEVWAVNVLSESQQALSEHFALPWDGTRDPLAGIAHRPGATGAPLLDGCVAWLECRLLRGYDGGDHSIYLGEVLDGWVAAGGAPLLYFASQYGRLGTPDDARDLL